MGRSSFSGVSDGEWAVFAEKVARERDEAREEIGRLRAELTRERNAARAERDALRRSVDAEFDEISETLIEYAGDIAGLLDILRSVEWVMEPWDVRETCPMCLSEKREGHVETCRLGARLKQGDDGAPSSLSERAVLAEKWASQFFAIGFPTDPNAAADRAGQAVAEVARLRKVLDLERAARQQAEDERKAEIARLRALLQKREHYHSDDVWFCCPKCDAPDHGGWVVRDGKACNCGADEWNARVAAALGEGDGAGRLDEGRRNQGADPHPGEGG